MNTKKIMGVLVVFLNLVSFDANASLSFSNLTISPTTFSVEISGTVPNDIGVNDHSLFVFENIPYTASPGFVLDSAYFVPASSYEFSGAQTSLQLITGSSGFGDYFYHRFTTDLASGEVLSGTLEGVWPWAVFDPSAVDNINIYWGGGSFDTTPGVLVGTATVNAVPVPASVWLFGSGLFGLIRVAKRNKYA